jgi:hypothetical protein
MSLLLIRPHAPLRGCQFVRTLTLSGCCLTAVMASQATTAPIRVVHSFSGGTTDGAFRPAHGIAPCLLVKSRFPIARSRSWRSTFAPESRVHSTLGGMSESFADVHIPTPFIKQTSPPALSAEFLEQSS